MNRQGRNCYQYLNQMVCREANMEVPAHDLPLGGSGVSAQPEPPLASSGKNAYYSPSRNPSASARTPTTGTAHHPPQRSQPARTGRSTFEWLLHEQ